jgi:signal transduction histidine kinase
MPDAAQARRLLSGQASSIAATGSRLGLANMRDRVEALGGALAAGPGPDGGFSLHARIPLAPAPALAAVS